MAAPTPLHLSPDQQLLASTSTHARLLIAQAVFRVGNDDYEGVAGLLRSHALLRSRDGEEAEGWLDPQNLRAIYDTMVREVGLDASIPRAAQSAELRKIAHKYYMDRVYELHKGMQECQDQFRITYAELEELKSGKMDWKLTHPGNGAPPQMAGMDVGARSG